jgi:hypothetical protein
MQDEMIVTKEEMSALFSLDKVPQDHLEAIRPRILKRVMLIVLILLIRAIAVIYYPEYLVLDAFKEGLSDPDVAFNLTIARLSLAFFCIMIYLYSFYINVHFRLANTTVLIVLCTLIWRDFESLLLLDLLSSLTIPSLGFMVIRFIAVGLLMRNYLDLNR